MPDTSEIPGNHGWFGHFAIVFAYGLLLGRVLRRLDDAKRRLITEAQYRKYVSLPMVRQSAGCALHAPGSLSIVGFDED
jgi:hypothetical protein